MTDKPKPQLVTADHSLKDKIGKDVNLKNIFTEERIAAGQQAIQDIQDDFSASIEEELSPVIEMGRKDPASAKTKALFLKTIASEKNKAESLGYKMLALVLDSLGKYSQKYLPEDKHAAIIVGKHIDILEITLRNKTIGDGHPVNNQLIKALPELIAHFHPSGK